MTRSNILTSLPLIASLLFEVYLIIFQTRRTRLGGGGIHVYTTGVKLHLLFICNGINLNNDDLYHHSTKIVKIMDLRVMTLV